MSIAPTLRRDVESDGEVGKDPSLHGPGGYFESGDNFSQSSKESADWVKDQDTHQMEYAERLKKNQIKHDYFKKIKKKKKKKKKKHKK